MISVKELGDRHNGVATSYIKDGDSEYIKKYRNALTERAWGEFLCALEKEGMKNLPRCVQILSEDENSHTEKIVKHLPTDRDGAKRFFVRMGTFLFLTYLFSSTDFHAENIIANGEFPVAVDLETLLSSNIKRANNKSGIIESCYASGLLPKYYGETDFSGLGANIEGLKNLPFGNEKVYEAKDYLKEITDGFSSGYDFALNNKGKILPLISLFENCKFREITRKTDIYCLIIERVLKSENKEETARDLLSRAYIKDADKNRINEAKLMLEAEIKSVLNGDVPLFYGLGNSKDLYFENKIVLKDFYSTSHTDFARKKLEKLSLQDKQNQLKIIEFCFSSKKPLTPQTTEENNILKETDSALEKVFLKDFKSSFIAFKANVKTVGLQPIGFGLYYGISGIMCYYAAAFSKTKDEKYLEKTLFCIDSIKNEFLKSPSKETVFEKQRFSLTDNSCGLLNGISGIISALIHTYELTGEKSAYDTALKLAERIDISKISVKKHDVLSGLSGLCTVLPKLPREISEPIARVCLPELLSAAPDLTGYGHGAGGMAAALGALGFVTGETEVNAKILELLNFENKYYDSKSKNWLDLRDSEKSFMNGWCSGAPGIALSRKRLLRYTADKQIADICKKDINRVKEYLKMPVKNGRATLCCGEASRVMAAAILNVNCKNTLNTCIYAESPRLYHPLKTADCSISLMQGICGAGYAYLMQNDERCGDML